MLYIDILNNCVDSQQSIYLTQFSKQFISSVMSPPTFTGVGPYFRRLKSFENWIGAISDERLARAGFCATNVSNKTICCVCQTEVSDWKDDDDPWLIHYNQSPSCPFIASNPKAIRNAKDRVQIKNQLKSSTVKELVANGIFTYKDIEEALEYYLIEYSIVPQTLNGIIYVTNKYLTDNKD